MSIGTQTRNHELRNVYVSRKDMVVLCMKPALITVVVDNLLRIFLQAIFDLVTFTIWPISNYQFSKIRRFCLIHPTSDLWSGNMRRDLIFFDHYRCNELRFTLNMTSVVTSGFNANPQAIFDLIQYLNNFVITPYF